MGFEIPEFTLEVVEETLEVVDVVFGFNVEAVLVEDVVGFGFVALMEDAGETPDFVAGFGIEEAVAFAGALLLTGIFDVVLFMFKFFFFLKNKEGSRYFQLLVLLVQFTTHKNV